MTLQQFMLEARKEFDKEFTYLNPYDKEVYFLAEGTPQEVKDFIDALITKAYEAGQKSNEDEINASLDRCFVHIDLLKKTVSQIPDFKFHITK